MVRYASAAALGLVASLAIAAPGAHGPDGEHLDAKTATAGGAGLPRVEAATEQFELVASLEAGTLTIVVDRYDTNEPVLDAKLEVESGPHKAVAAFRAERGDYVVNDAELLKALAAPGEHGLVFTLAAGKDADLLDGTLVVARGAAGAAGSHDRQDHAHDNDDGSHTHGSGRWIGAGIVALALLAAIGWWRRRRRNAAPAPTLEPRP